MNLILLFLIIAEVCLGLCCWISPQALRSLAAHLLTRADVIEAARKEHFRRLQFWQSELGIGGEDPTRETPAMEVVHAAFRR